MIRSETYRNLTAVLLVALPVAAPAHHSLFGYDQEELIEFEGEIVDVFWRNPHVRISVRVADESGTERVWDIESSPVNQMERRGVSEDQFTIGDRIHFLGNPSTRIENNVRPVVVTLAGGQALVFEEAIAEEYGLLDDNAAASAGAALAAAVASSDATGIFRVWTNRDRHWMSDVRGWWARDFPLTASARAKFDAWDEETDDPAKQCIPAGMPEAMLMPFPIEFIDNGDSITLNIEEWDNSRTIHLNAEHDPDAPPSHLGYSVGRWEGSTLIVETKDVDYGFFNDQGIPQSDALEVVERFTISENDTKLDWTAVVTDPETFEEPIVMPEFHWDWIPTQELKSYNCIVDEG